ncbi:hypothetical protein JTB14_000867 [Gonioctena quinquepunctata]|nr:hypothetical protein JTB14_000867 [Gonioctena quinquepunctata]
MCSSTPAIEESTPSQRTNQGTSATTSPSRRRHTNSSGVDYASSTVVPFTRKLKDLTSLSPNAEVICRGSEISWIKSSHITLTWKIFYAKPNYPYGYIEGFMENLRA